jgi:hypothetical protein
LGIGHALADLAACAIAVICCMTARTIWPSAG